MADDEIELVDIPQISDPTILQAIRVAEQGRPGKELGVESVPALTHRDQLQVAARTVAHAESDYRTNLGRSPTDQNGRYTPDFLTYFSQGGPGHKGYATDPNHARNVIYGYNQAVNYQTLLKRADAAETPPVPATPAATAALERTGQTPKPAGTLTLSDPVTGTPVVPAKSTWSQWYDATLGAAHRAIQPYVNEAVRAHPIGRAFEAWTGSRAPWGSEIQNPVGKPAAGIVNPVPPTLTDAMIQGALIAAGPASKFVGPLAGRALRTGAATLGGVAGAKLEGEDPVLGAIRGALPVGAVEFVPAVAAGTARAPGKILRRVLGTEGKVPVRVPPSATPKAPPAGPKAPEVTPPVRQTAEDEYARLEAQYRKQTRTLPSEPIPGSVREALQAQAEERYPPAAPPGERAHLT